MDIIWISNLIVPVKIGYTRGERKEPQRLRIDLKLKTDFAHAIATNDLLEERQDGRKDVDYGRIRKFIKAFTSEGEFILLESLAHALLVEIFCTEDVTKARISIRKLDIWDDAVPGVILVRTPGECGIVTMPRARRTI